MMVLDEYGTEIEKWRVISDTLIIGMDCSSHDIPVMTIARLNGVKLETLNVFTGDEAVDLYYKLVVGAGERKENNEATEETYS